MLYSAKTQREVGFVGCTFFSCAGKPSLIELKIFLFTSVKGGGDHSYR
jgi:hypothetical protein